MTKLKQLYFILNSVWNIADLFKLSVAKFMYSFDNGELPKYFDNFFSDIASVYRIKQAGA